MIDQKVNVKEFNGLKKKGIY